MGRRKGTHHFAPVVDGADEDNDEENVDVVDGIHVVEVKAASPHEKGG